MFILAMEVAVCVAVEAAGLALSLGVVWYVNNALPEARRTLVNRIIAYQCQAAALLTVTLINIIILGKVFGGLYLPCCDVLIVVAKGSLFSNLFAADAVVVLRYVFTCRFKNVVACNDDLIYKAVTTVLKSLPFYFTSLMWFAGARFSPMYRLCTAEEDATVRVGYPAVAAVAFSLFLHSVLGLRIVLHKRKVARTTDTLTKGSLMSLWGNAGIFVIILASYAAVVVASRAVGDRWLADAWPLVHAVFLFSVFVPAVYYAKNPDMARKVVTAIRNIMFITITK